MGESDDPTLTYGWTPRTLNLATCTLATPSRMDASPNITVIHGWTTRQPATGLTGGHAASNLNRLAETQV